MLWIEICYTPTRRFSSNKVADFRSIAHNYVHNFKTQFQRGQDGRGVPHTSHKNPCLGSNKSVLTDPHPLNPPKIELKNGLCAGVGPRWQIPTAYNC